MSNFQQINDMYMSSGLVRREGSRWKCHACGSIGSAPMDIPHSPGCALCDLVLRAAASLPDPMGFSGEDVAAIMSHTPRDIRMKVENMVQELVLADTPEQRMPVICEIKRLCPHSDDSFLAALATGGVPDDDTRRALTLMLMHSAARLEPLAALNDAVSSLREESSKYDSIISAILPLIAR